ncbi:hypothetical protein [Pseudomonas palleroniana]|uniref:hypothetical protein n=1 Tax=Pseudomonas palleroniana TaxID=191390 RepID=UPI001FD4F45A|nr:hypothetical protein [Pseudomonas palleroniana]UOP09137.1 hypothetical protein LDL65_18785 [Pseudomonas palleroniana]
MNRIIKKHQALRCGAWILGPLCLATLGFFAWQSFYPVQASDGWSYSVIHRDVAKAASLMPLHDGSLMVSQELKDGLGSIVRIHADGQREVVVANLSKPDGMVATRGGWVFSQESGGAPVSFLKDGAVTELFRGENVQGLWVEGDDLYAIEDRKPTGRLMRYRWSDQSLSVLRDQVEEGESIVRCTDGRMLYTEKKKGVVRELTDDGSDPVVLAGLNKPTFLMCDERGLWVNEDSSHRARLLLIDPRGEQQTILSFLKAPQSIVPTGRGTYLLAEGGRNRVLELVPQTLAVSP